MSDASRNLLRLLEGGPKTAEELKRPLGFSDKTLYKHLNLLLDLRRVQVLPFRQERGWGSLFFLPSHVEQAVRMTGFSPAEGVSLFLIPPGEFPADPAERIRHWMHWQFVQSERIMDHALRAMRGLSPLVLRLLRWRRLYQRVTRRVDLLMEFAGASADAEFPEGLQRRLLLTEERYLRANRGHPDHSRLVAALSQHHRDTLGLIRKLLGAQGGDYASWFRSALPTREEAAGVVQRERALFEATADALRSGAIRVPGFMREPLVGLLTFMHREYFDLLEREMAAFYAPRGTGP